MTAVIFVESNTSGSGAEFLGAASDAGYSVHFLTARPERYSFLPFARPITVERCDTTDFSSLRQICGRIGQAEEIAAILSTSDSFVLMAARLAQAVGRPSPAPEAVALCRDKVKQMSALQRAGVRVAARHISVSSPDEVIDAVGEIGCPLVVKPVVGTGSIGVRLALTLEEAISAVFAITSTDDPVAALDRRALLASFVEGAEYSVEILDGAVVGVTAKHLSALPFFVELGHDYPAPISEESHADISALAIRAITAVGLNQGPAHVELRNAANGPTIIEINPRLAGGMIPRLIALSTGVNLVKAVLDRAVGKIEPIRASKKGFGAIRFLVPPSNGKVTEEIDFDAARRRFSLADVNLYRALPFDFIRHNDFRDRIGHVIAVGPTLIDASERARAAIDFLWSSRE